MNLKSSLVIFMLFYTCSGLGAKDKLYYPGYTYVEAKNSVYKLHERANFTVAKRICESEGAILFYPEDLEETTILNWTDKIGQGESLIIGVTDSLSEGRFETVDGKLIESVYHNWGSGEPNDANDDEDCVMFRPDMTLNDIECRPEFPFICKKSLKGLQWNSECNMEDIDYSYNEKTKRCYKFHLNPMNWTDAHFACAAEKSYLAVINSQVEAQHLVKMTAEAPTSSIMGDFVKGIVHLGFHNRDGEGWRTHRGKKLEKAGYTLWGYNQPDGGENEKCGSMFYNGHLNDISCDTKSFFICEHER